jgi:hypothetical protein
MSVNHLPGNPYSAQVDRRSGDHALTTATLALAHEQRTANLIALWSNPESSSGSVTWGIGDERIGQMLQEIQQRLGVQL